MPYLTWEEKDKTLETMRPETPGQLNYLITVLLLRYVSSREELRYQVINDVIGAIESAKQEFYRRVAVPYENKKIKQNGDVYGDIEC